MRAGAAAGERELGTNWSLHDLRHTTATRMADDPQMTLREVQAVLRHPNIDKDVRGLWMGTGGEGAMFWLSVLIDRKNRGETGSDVAERVRTRRIQGTPTARARILDSALKRRDDSAATTDLVEALVYRAELALALNDSEQADSLLTQVADMTLDDTDRDRLGDALANAEELRRVLRADRQPGQA
jgi:hypothetical protein